MRSSPGGGTRTDRPEGGVQCVGGRKGFLSMSLARAEGAWAFDVTSVSRNLIILLKGTLILLTRRGVRWGRPCQISDMKRQEAT